jgi:O-antigen/teichoic acid export membrane protein
MSRQVVARGAFSVLSGRVVGTIAGLLTYVALGRGLGASGAGLYSLAMAVYTVALVVARLGFDVGALRIVAAKRGTGDLAGAAATASAVLSSAAVFGVVVGGILFASAPLAASFFHAPGLELQVRVVAGALPFGTVGLVAAGALQGAERLGYAVWSREVLQQALTAITIGLIAFLPLLAGAPPALAIAVPAVIVGTMLWWSARARFGLTGISLVGAFRGPEFREALEYSWPLAFNTAFVTGMMLTDTLMVGYFLPVSELGRYSTAAKVVRLVPFGLSAAGNVFAPLAASLYAQSDRRRLELAYRATARWGWHLGAPLSVLLLVRPELVLGVFGREFAGAATVMRILTAGQLVNIVTGACGTMLMMSGNQKVEARNTLTAVVLGFVLCAALIPALGAVGAAWGTAVSLAAVNVLRAAQVVRRVGLRPFSAGLWRAGGAAALSGLLLAIIPVPRGWRLYELLVEQGLLAVGLYAALVLAFRLDRDDWRLVGSLRGTPSVQPDQRQQAR